MTSADSAPDPLTEGAANDALALMERNGITLVTANQYHVDGYRYSNLADALAQVRRGSARRAAP